MMSIFKKKLNKKGFTLIELVVVIAILGILALVAIPRFTGMRANANESAVVSNLRNIQTATEVLAAQKNVDITTIDADSIEATNLALLTTNLGNWPVGPGAITYTVVDGKATAALDWTIPLPNPCKSAFDGKNFSTTAKP